MKPRVIAETIVHHGGSIWLAEDGKVYLHRVGSRAVYDTVRAAISRDKPAMVQWLSAHGPMTPFGCWACHDAHLPRA